MVVFFLQQAYFCRLLVCKWSNSFSGLAEWERTVVNIFLQQNKTCCNLHSLSGEFSCSLRSSLRYLNDNDMMFQFQKDTMMIKNGAGSESYNIHMLRLSVSIHDTSVNVPQTHEIAESAMRSQLEGDVLPIWWWISKEAGTSKQGGKEISNQAGTRSPAILLWNSAQLDFWYSIVIEATPRFKARCSRISYDLFCKDVIRFNSMPPGISARRSARRSASRQVYRRSLIWGKRQVRAVRATSR